MINGLIKMYDIVSENPRYLLILEFFDIPLGFGDQTVREICKSNNLNEHLFLTVLNLHCCKEAVSIDISNYGKADAHQVLKFLKASHIYFLNEKIPRLKKLIEEKITSSPEDKYTKLINKFVHDYAGEVFEHMNYENTIVFSYVKSLLLDEDKVPTYNIDQFKKHHTNIEEKLTDLKNLLIKHIPPEYDNLIRRQLLMELHTLEQDINVHDYIENNLLIPIIEKMEN